MVKTNGKPNHNSKGNQSAEHVEKRRPHAIGAVLLGPHEDHGQHLKDGSGRTHNGNALDAKPHLGRAKNNIGGNSGGKNASIEERRHPHALAGIEAANQHRLQAKPKAYGQIPAEDFGNGFGSFTMESPAFKEDSHRRETEGPHGDHRRNQNAEHAGKAFPDFLVQAYKVTLLNKAGHVRITCDADGEPEDGHQRVHDTVGVVEAGDTACTEVRSEATDDEFQAEHGAYAKGHGEHHHEIAYDIRVGGLDQKLVVHAATPGAVNLQGKEADKGAHRHAPGKTFQAEIRAGVLTERDSCRTPAYDGQVVNKASQGGNQELLAGVLHRHQDTPHEDEHLAGQDDTTVVCRALDKFRRGAFHGQKLQKLLHPDKGGNDEDQKRDAEGVQHVAEELPASPLVTGHLVARENRDEDNRQETGTHHMVQDIRNHEGQVKGILFKGHTCRMGQEHLAENPEDTAQEHGCGNDNGGFVHGLVTIK